MEQLILVLRHLEAEKQTTTKTPSNTLHKKKKKTIHQKNVSLNQITKIS